MKIQRILNDNILLQEGDKSADIGIINIKTHYNSYKGDLMFTFYKDDKKWKICYNERSGMWITRYSWIPLLSENINNKSFSSREKYYKDLYNTVMLSDAMKSQYSSLKEKVKDEKSKLNEKVSKIEKIKNFLENNKDAWEIKDDKIQ